MNVVASLLVVLMPVSVVFAIVTVARGLGRRGREGMKERLLVSAAVFVVCLGVLFFTGRFFSLAMTFRMPQISGASHSGISGPLKLDSRDPLDFTGKKAVTLTVSFGAYTNAAQEIAGIPGQWAVETLFKYSHDYIPAEYRAAGVEDVGYVVVVRHYATKSTVKYTNGATAWSHDVEVTICNDQGCPAHTVFEGGYRASTGTSGGILGPAPTGAVREWVADQLARLIP